MSPPGASQRFVLLRKALLQSCLPLSSVRRKPITAPGWLRTCKVFAHLTSINWHPGPKVSVCYTVYISWAQQSMSVVQLQCM